MKIQLINSLLNHPKEKVFLFIKEKCITYGDFLVLVSKSITYLSKINKNYIFILAEKNEYTLAIYFACLKIGKIACFVDPLSKSPEKFVKLAEEEGFLFSNKDYSEIISCDFDLINNSSQINHNEMSEIIFTTGTTGDPKGVLLSHDTVFETAKNINRFTQLSSSDIEIHMMPISYSFGLARIRCCILQGCSIIFHDGFGNLLDFFKSLEKHKGTVISTVPAGIIFLMKLAKEKLMDYRSQIKMIELGSSPMTANDKKLLAEILPKTQICMHYGLTEASRSTFLNFKNDLRNINSVGKANFGTEISIMGENGFVLKENEPGEICIKGSNLFSKYIFSDHKPNFYNDYFRTGDYGYINDEGYLFFEARKDEMINIAGKKISPIEIEKYLNQISYIKDSACIEVINKKTGFNEIKAFVILSGSIIKDFEKSVKLILKKELEYYKIPTSIDVVEKIPKSHNGKILRKELKEINKC